MWPVAGSGSAAPRGPRSVDHQRPSPQSRRRRRRRRQPQYHRRPRGLARRAVLRRLVWARDGQTRHPDRRRAAAASGAARLGPASRIAETSRWSRVMAGQAALADGWARRGCPGRSHQMSEPLSRFSLARRLRTAVPRCVAAKRLQRLYRRRWRWQRQRRLWLQKHRHPTPRVRSKLSRCSRGFACGPANARVQLSAHA